jgi:hypothetical protein
VGEHDRRGTPVQGRREHLPGGDADVHQCALGHASRRVEQAQPCVHRQYDKHLGGGRSQGGEVGQAVPRRPDGPRRGGRGLEPPGKLSTREEAAARRGRKAQLGEPL